jgi:hypothetical protein
MPAAPPYQHVKTPKQQCQRRRRSVRIDLGCCCRLEARGRDDIDLRIGVRSQQFGLAIDRCKQQAAWV